MLYPPTCVGLVRAPRILLRGFFLEAWAYRLHLELRLTSQVYDKRICLLITLHASRGRPEPRPATLLRHPIVITNTWWYRNINLLCIGYACLPRLSSRLTLGGLALPRKPWIYGGDVSHISLVTHASILTSYQSTKRYHFASTQIRKLPYH